MGLCPLFAPPICFNFGWQIASVQEKHDKDLRGTATKKTSTSEAQRNTRQYKSDSSCNREENHEDDCLENDDVSEDDDSFGSQDVQDFLQGLLTLHDEYRMESRVEEKVKTETVSVNSASYNRSVF